MTMTFSIRQLFALILVIGPAIGIALTNGRLGIYLCIAYVAITVGLLFLVNRTLKTWRTVNFLRRAYGIILSTLCSGLWLWFLANIADNPSIQRTRIAANLQTTLSLDERFESVSIEYVELKPKFLNVTGTLKSEDDLMLLRKMISDRNWKNMDGVYWRVRILSSNRDLDEWDSNLNRL
jgi:hypothetical protein